MNIENGRIIDDAGHAWPITGHWCEVCRMPLIPTDDKTVHPLCERNDR